jgi:hypothetical protein
MDGSARVSTPFRFLGCTVAILAFLLAAPAARAACDDQVLEQPFAQWSDSAYYTLVGDGDLTGGGAGWILEGAELVDDNEPWYVHGGDTPAALRLGVDDRATSPPICVTPDHPTMRFFARNAGTARSSLLVEVMLDLEQALPIGEVSGSVQGEDWAPSQALPIIANEFDDEVAFRFTTIGGGEWVIDDIYVDPYKKG